MIQRPLGLGCLCIILFLSACTQAQSKTTPKIVYEPVAAANSNRAAAMTESRSPLEFDSGQVVDTCQEYWRKKAKSPFAETTANLLAAQEYLICDTLRLIEESSQNHIELDSSISIGQTLAERVDLRSFRSSMYQLTDDEKYTLAALAPSAEWEAYRVDANREDWRYELRVVARIDANNDGKEDWIVWLTDQSETGTYNIRQAFVVYNIKREGLLSLESL